MSGHEKENPFAALDGRKASVVTDHAVITVESLKDADEALAFLENHPRAAEIAEEGNAILEDPVRRKRLIRKIDFTIAPLLAAVYFLQFLDKTTLSYTAVMGIRTDTHLVGQDYSNLSMLFYVGMDRRITLYVLKYTLTIATFRLSCCRISYPIPSATHFSFRSLSGNQHRDMGVYSWLPCSMHDLRWPFYCSDVTRNF